MPKQDKTWTTCNLCGASVLVKNLSKHMQKAHRMTAPAPAAAPASCSVRIFNRETVKCSACGVMVRRDCMEDHIREMHPKPVKTGPPEKQSPTGKPLVKCEICGTSVRRDRLRKHQSRVHQEARRASVTESRSDRTERRDAIRSADLVDRRTAKGEQLVQCRTCGVFVESAILDSHQCKHRSRTKKRSEKGAQIILYSDRYRKIRSGGRCSECGFMGDVVWRYRDSNQGTVQLCRECQPKVLDRSFGRLDAIERSWISSFETSRRKH